MGERCFSFILFADAPLDLVLGLVVIVADQAHVGGCELRIGLKERFLAEALFEEGDEEPDRNPSRAETGTSATDARRITSATSEVFSAMSFNLLLISFFVSHTGRRSQGRPSGQSRHDG
jgi:hypothetical protein